ncbi:membrane protein [Candidatus Magnetobacterium bavaricum]|uniref:Membrane protein n=1 Tax=Candidatus Magnetobacterium bavaricum TaxID=29290 RepID=A0A0F3GSD1_9BACT|nr:membrane protein [Candidatus Magnetobacterium bavaricum]
MSHLLSSAPVASPILTMLVTIGGKTGMSFSKVLNAKDFFYNIFGTLIRSSSMGLLLPIMFSSL